MTDIRLHRMETLCEELRNRLAGDLPLEAIWPGNADEPMVTVALAWEKGTFWDQIYQASVSTLAIWETGSATGKWMINLNAGSASSDITFLLHENYLNPEDVARIVRDFIVNYGLIKKEVTI